MIKDMRSNLGPPYYSREGVTLYNSDCVEGMKRISPGTIDLTITSPPYNIGKDYEKNLPLDQYLDWCSNWICEIHRITTFNGAFWLNLGYVSIEDRAKAIPIPYLLWHRVPFFLIQEIIWNYGAGVAGRLFFSPRNEKFLWYVKNPSNYTFNLDDVRDADVKYPNQKKNGKKKCNPMGKNPCDVWTFPKVTSGHNRSSVERTDHPAQFPEEVIRRIVLASSNPGDLILDSFMGSGTTAVVAASLGRDVIGFEIRRDYCEIAAKRLDKYFEDRDLTLQQMKLSL